MTGLLRVAAPATTANLGPAFDCAGVALDLWNELEVADGDGVVVEGEGAGETPLGPDHLGLRAFALLAPVAGRRFRFRNRIPLASGLGSSAATIALGLTAAAAVLERQPAPEELLALGLRLESHADNLAPALAGGVCLTWEEEGRQRLARIADSLPLAPVAVLPRARVPTDEARAALPAQVSHEDAAFTAGRAALLGAALAAGSAGLLAAALQDRLHEPYRGPLSPVYGPIRDELPAGALGLTISGSGPAVLVWVRPEHETTCASELASRFPDARVLPLAVTGLGAGLRAP